MEKKRNREWYNKYSPELYFLYRDSRLKARKKYYDKNKKKYAKYNKEYQKKNAEKIKKQRKEYYDKNRDKILKQKRDSYIKRDYNWWNDWEDEILLSNYGIFQARELVPFLNNRSISSIQYRAKKLGLFSNLYSNKGERNSMWGKEHSEKTKNKISKKAIKKFENSDERLKISKSVSKLWKNPIYAKKQIKSFQLKPTIPEKQVMQIIQMNKLPFRYVGDGKLIVGGFCPDFISKNPKHIIEVNGDYFHNLPKAREKDKRKYRYYRSLGYRCLVVWESELKSNPQKVTEKIIDFFLN